MPPSDQPYHVTAMQSYFAQESARVQDAVAQVSRGDEARQARHAASRVVTCELIALRAHRNSLGKLIEKHPLCFAGACVVLYLSYSFWHWWLTSPATEMFGDPLRQSLHGWAW